MLGQKSNLSMTSNTLGNRTQTDKFVNSTTINNKYQT